MYAQKLPSGEIAASRGIGRGLDLTAVDRALTLSEYEVWSYRAALTDQMDNIEAVRDSE